MESLNFRFMENQRSCSPKKHVIFQTKKPRTVKVDSLFGNGIGALKDRNENFI